MKRALISVSDKTGILEFVQKLVENNYEIIATGGTKDYLEDNGVNVISVEHVTNFPEILDGRVKTLNPFIHGGLLAQRDNPKHMKTLAEQKITPIDLIAVNLYPFKQTIMKQDTTLKDAINNIDIGGPSMIRSAAKNYQDVTVVVDFNDYEKVIDEIKHKNNTSLELRYNLAAKAFRYTASYDAIIAQYLTNKTDIYPEKLTLTYDLKEKMRYGENSHQKAYLYEDTIVKPYSILQAKQLNGKKLSYNNIKDADEALRIIREFNDPTVVALKHMNPCGIGRSQSLEKAWDLAYSSDPVSIFGGVVALNRKVDLATAQKMHKLFLEIIIAPDFDEDALIILKKKKNLRLLKLDFAQKDSDFKNEIVSIMGGILIQEQDTIVDDPNKWKVVTDNMPTNKQLEALLFAFKAVKHVKSNAIVVANNEHLLGVGAGQPNRIDAEKIAIDHAEDEIDQNAVLASDAFFPFDDCVEYAAKHGIKAIVEPGGSIRDQDSIDMANKYGIAMVFTGVRHFRH